MHKLVLALIVLGSFSIKLTAQGEILGTWYNEEKDSKIKVYKENGKYFGKVVWIKNNTNDDGSSPKLDSKNPDTSKRTRAIIGTQILKNLKWDSDDQEWNQGVIYDPKSGKTYDVYARMEAANTLYLKGYIGFTLIGRSTLWTRVE